MDKFIESERIYLRSIEESDIPTMLNWINDRDVIRSLVMQYFPVNEQWEREWVKNLYKSRDDVILAIIVKENDTHIGNAGLHRIDFVNRNAEYGIMIGNKNYWGKGYCLEVTKLMLYYGFEILNLHRIYLRVFDFNERAKNCYIKTGFIEEGNQREAIFVEGKYHNILMMSILKDEWK